jgi:aspartate ammonia-lyase
MQKKSKTFRGAQTAKAIKNFPFSFRSPQREFIYAIVEIKKSAAIGHALAGELSKERKQAIVKTCDEILSGKYLSSFVLPAFQGGAGTSNHMNVNEVIALRATEISRKNKGKTTVHPNDHVNMSHSTNDVMPSALRISALRMTDKLLFTLDNLIVAFEKKSKQFAHIKKLGRTHMQDAVPITLGQEFSAYSEYIKRGKARIEHAREAMLELNLGGSAVGNSINASPKYIAKLYPELRKVTGLPFRPTKNLMAGTSSNTDFVALSQSLTALCVDLSKIANDFRLLASGPKGGLGEIMLPTLQPGSSIMPGKVNPILPEAINQLYFLVSGNNLTIEHAAEASQLELGVMLPVVTDRLLESLKLMDELLMVFAKKCVSGIKANAKRCHELLENSLAYATILSPVIGYDNVAMAVKYALATGKTLREVVVVDKKLLTPQKFDQLTK